MDQGKVAEVGSPLELLAEHDEITSVAMHLRKGIFKSLVEGLGPERKQAFLAIAANHQS
jgi:hypothetical protein